MKAQERREQGEQHRAGMGMARGSDSSGCARLGAQGAAALPTHLPLAAELAQGHSGHLSVLFALI